jgi:hypothetical protein
MPTLQTPAGKARDRLSSVLLLPVPDASMTGVTSWGPGSTVRSVSMMAR